jgi:GntR family transcriptional regulator, transcriptional repressor for pyruvate dehydrogenase complex
MTIASDRRVHEMAPRAIKRSAKIAQTVAKELVQEIVSRKLAPGTLLPSEPQMLEDFGIGRNSLREAFRILESYGLITMKPGKNGGPMVIEVGTRDYGHTLSFFLHIGGVTLQQLIDARLVMEPLMARLAAERRAQDLQDEVPDPAGTPLGSDDDAYFSATQDFHKKVASMSGNPVLDIVAMSMEDIFHEQISGLLFPRSRRKEVLATHQEIARAIAEGRADDAENLMRDHMKTYANYVRKRHGQRVDEVVDWL